MNTEFVKDRLSKLDIGTGITKVIGVRPTSEANQVQVVLAEKIDRPSNRRAVSDSMADHEAFGGRSAQPVWLSFTLTMLEKLMPAALPAAKQCIEDQDYVSLDLTNPKFGDSRLRIEINETHKPSKWEMDNVEKAAKQDGEGNYLHWNNLAIFVNADVVKGDPQHRFIQHTGTTTDVHSLDYSTEEYNAEQAIQASAGEAQEAEKELTEGAEA